MKTLSTTASAAAEQFQQVLRKKIKSVAELDVKEAKEKCRELFNEKAYMLFESILVLLTKNHPTWYIGTDDRIMDSLAVRDMFKPTLDSIKMPPKHFTFEYLGFTFIKWYASFKLQIYKDSGGHSQQRCLQPDRVKQRYAANTLGKIIPTITFDITQKQEERRQ